MSDMAKATRDPVSVQFDRAAARELTRARAAAGRWVTTRLADPTPRDHARWLASDDIDVTGPDPVTVLPGRGVNARTRWCRAFVRSLYYMHKQGPGGALQVDVGRFYPAYGKLPAGRRVRLRIMRAGRLAELAVRRLPDSARIFDDDGALAMRHAGPETRDWEWTE